MLNRFVLDAPYIATPWLLHLARQRRLPIWQVFRVIFDRSSSSLHLVVLLVDGRYLCDCCMGENLGVPCRH